jgi:predicted phage tail protein
LLPGNGSLTRAEAYFDWLDVEDDSVPVTYNLEIASDQNFASPVLLKTGITESQYTLTGDEALAANFKDAPYFWRAKAIDGAGNASEWSTAWVFYVSVPSVPTMSLPANDSSQEYPIRFSWNAVTSLSPPVTYDLQIASNLDFTSPVLEETGLKSSDLLISKDSKINLKKGETYYWRVKAVDAAMNSSDWSPAGSFRFTPKSTFPSWAIYTLIIIAAVIAILFAYRLGRKTAYRQDTNYL